MGRGREEGKAAKPRSLSLSLSLSLSHSQKGTAATAPARAPQCQGREGTGGKGGVSRTGQHAGHSGVRFETLRPAGRSQVRGMGPQVAVGAWTGAWTGVWTGAWRMDGCLAPLDCSAGYPSYTAAPAASARVCCLALVRGRRAMAGPETPAWMAGMDALPSSRGNAGTAACCLLPTCPLVTFALVKTRSCDMCV